MQKRQQFTAEFKREAVRLLKAGDRPVAMLDDDATVETGPSKTRSGSVPGK